MAAGGNLSELISAAGGGPHSFQIQETAGFDGNQTISWTTYISVDTVLDGSDTIRDFGTIAALTAGSTSAVIQFDDNLPAFYGYYYIIIQLTAGDDSNIANNSYTSSRISVWQTSGNIESDQNENDTYLSMAEDYAILLNPGDTVQIDGIIDEYTFNDLFLVTTGSLTTGLDISLTWITGDDDLDFYLYDETGTSVGSSAETANDSEPAAPPWSSPVLSSNAVYYVQVRAYLGGDTPPSSSPGQPYTLIITGN